MSYSPKYTIAHSANLSGVHEDKPTRDEGKALSRTDLSAPESMSVLSQTKDVTTVSAVISPILNFPQLSPDTAERVFPIRSVVTADSTPSSLIQTPSLEICSPFGEDLDPLIIDTKRCNSNMPYANDVEQGTASSDFDEKGPRAGGGADQKSHMPVRMSKNGSQPSLFASEIKEPLQDIQESVSRSAEIQGFGALLALQEVNGGLSVQIASENTKDIIGYTPEELLGLHCFCGVLHSDQRDDFMGYVRLIREERYDIEQHGPEILILSISSPDGAKRSLWCAMHISKKRADYIICELEPEDNSVSVFSFIERSDLGLRAERSNPRPVTGIETHTATGSVRALRMFEGRKKEFDLTYVLNATSRVLQLAWNAQSLNTLFNSISKAIRDLIGFYRVTVFQFDSNWNGIIVAGAADTGTFSISKQDLGVLQYVSSEDLRRFHLLTKVRLLYDENLPRVKLLYRLPEEASQRANVAHSYLLLTSFASDGRTAMPSNIRVSIGIYVFGKLWGLILCQSFDRNTRLLPPIYKLCWLISNTLSSNVERLSYTLPFNIQDQSSTAEIKTYKCDTAHAGDIVNLFGADCGVSSTFGETKILGKPSDLQEILAVIEYLRMRALGRILWSTAIANDFPDLNYPPGFRSIAGLIYIPLSADSKDFIIFFKASQQTRPPNTDSHRTRRATWGVDERLRHPQPLVWSAVELGKAYILSVMYRTFAKVWQKKEAALQGTQLMRLLLANSAHELRTPLNAIINYIEIALDGSLGKETRENLSRSHSASKSLIYIINDLLNLTNAENGQDLIKDEPFDLSVTIREAAEIFWEETRQKAIELRIIEHSQLPRVLGDQWRVRQVITNLVSNAVQHTSTGVITVESCILSETLELERIAIEVAIHDTGAGMSEDTVEALFCELEQVSTKDYIRKTCKDNAGDRESKNVLGLGLALVARIVRHMDGQLSVKSEKNRGSCFKIRLKFPLPANEQCSDCESVELGNSGPDTGQDITEERGGQTTYEPSSCVRDQFSAEEVGDDSSRCDFSVSVTTYESQLSHFTKSDPSDLPKRRVGSGTASQLPEQTAIKTEEPKQALNILIAEDDPVNSTIICKRLQKFGHTVFLTGNGKECATVYQENPGRFDVILMDIQMPIVDGIRSTKVIREAALAGRHARVPILAVSASLMERDRQKYMDCGFDGWIMKPIDFNRVSHLLLGVRAGETRNNSVYEPGSGSFEKGGWFDRAV